MLTKVYDTMLATYRSAPNKTIKDLSAEGIYAGISNPHNNASSLTRAFEICDHLMNINKGSEINYATFISKGLQNPYNNGTSLALANSTLGTAAKKCPQKSDPIISHLGKSLEHPRNNEASLIQGFTCLAECSNQGCFGDILGAYKKGMLNHNNTSRSMFHGLLNLKDMVEARPALSSGVLTILEEAKKKGQDLFDNQMNQYMFYGIATDIINKNPELTPRVEKLTESPLKHRDGEYGTDDIGYSVQKYAKELRHKINEYKNQNNGNTMMSFSNNNQTVR